VSAPRPIAGATREFLAAPHRLLIGADWVEGSGPPIAVENPATTGRLCAVSAADAADLDCAVAAAAASDWPRLHGRDRARVLWRMADLMERDAETIGEIMTIDNGMPRASAIAVVRLLGAELFRYYAGWATKIAGEAFTPAVGSRADLAFLVATLREPVGVVGAIVPWNAPAGMIALKMAPALASGCTLVLKTAELAPLVGEYLARLWLEAGGAPGSFNLLHGTGVRTGAAMAAHGGIRKISFTGSTEVGRAIVRAATGNLKRVTLELGGKSPVVVFPDADLEKVIPAAAMACFLSTGQACMAGTRLFAHADIHDALVDGIAAYTRGLPIGDGMAEDIVLGPAISARQKSRIDDYIAIGKHEGCTVALSNLPLPARGHFVSPTIFTNVTMKHRIAREEIFGPVLSVLRFTDEAAMLADVNATDYGLSGSVWTRDIQRGLRVARAIDSGQVAINYHAAMSPETPFGGNRQSGWGREFGREGLDPYLKTKAISINQGTA
jgi:phenylacetaldehyde dehydrogenase